MSYQSFFHKIRWSLRYKLALAIAIAILFAVLAVTVINHIRYTSYFTRQTIVQTEQLLEQVGINVDTYLDELFRFTLAPYYSSDVMDLLDVQPINDIARLEKTRRIESFLDSVMTIPRTDILRVYIFTDEGLYRSEKTKTGIPHNFDYKNADWYDYAILVDGPVFLPVRSEVLSDRGEVQLFSVVRKLNSKSDNTLTTGIICVDANYSGINNICDKIRMQNGGGLYIIDNTGTLIYSNGLLDMQTRDFLLLLAHEQEEPLKAVTNNLSYIVNTYMLKSTDWMIVAINDYSVINKYVANTRNAALLVALFCASISIFLLSVSLGRFLLPMKNVVSLMELVERGNMQVRYIGQKHDDVGYLGESFNRMIDELEKSIKHNNDLLRAVYEAQYLEKEAQYNMLCSQIKPHFLYNSLNTISLLVKFDAINDAINAIEHLSTYFRGVINTNRDIPLSAELSIIDAYLKFQHIRYGEKLQYNINVNNEFNDFIIPALSLQPLVENAIVHGSEKVSDSVVINIYTICESNSWLICIEDNAGCMSIDTLNGLRERITYQNNNRTDISITHGIGLVNINRRIGLKYGRPYGIVIECEQSKNTRIMIRLPYAESEKSEV